MSRRLDGKVALITGAGRGQGRSHAVRLAREGAHVIAVDVVVANAGILPSTSDQRTEPGSFDAVLAVNLTGVFNTIEAALPTLLEQDEGGSIVITSSVAGLHGRLNFLGNLGQIGYTAAKHGVVGLMRSYAHLLAERSIRVNSVHPTGVNTPMIVNPSFGAFVEAEPSVVEKLGNAMPVDMIEAVDVSHAVAWLCSDEARYVTGVELPVDAGFLVR